MILNVRTLNRIGQLPELIVSEAGHDIDILCVQEHKYHHSEVEIKYYDTGNRWTFISASAWKNSVNAIIGGVGMFVSPCALKSLNSIEKIQPRMMVATFNGNPSTMIICYRLTNASDDTDLITFSLVRSIPKHNIVIVGGDMNAQIGKDENNEFGLHKWRIFNRFLT